MSRQTTNYGYNISEGSDLVNPLVDIFPNWEAIDNDLKDVSNDAVGRATELTTGTVHALTRSDTHRNVFVFTATSNFTAGDTFTLDGTQVSALTPAGEQLATGCYIIGSDVLVAVHGTLMTMYVSPTKVSDSDKLDGHDSTYFATASDLSDFSDDLDAVSNKVGTGVLTTTAQDCVGAINELNSDLSNVGNVVYGHSSTVAVANATDTDTESYTITEKGVYLIRLRANFPNNATGFRVLRCMINTLTENLISANAVVGTTTVIGGMWLVIHDGITNKTVKNRVYQNSGSTLNVTGDMSVIKLK